MATEKIPIRTVYDGATAVGLAEYQANEVVGVTYGGIGTNTLTSNSILLGNGTSAVQSSSIQIIGTTLSSSDSSTININEGLVVEGNLTVTGSITGTIANSSLTNSSITISDDSSSTSTLSLGETLKIAGGSGVDTTISGDTLTISLESNIVTETSSDTLTNKTISGADNTLTNIPNSALTNSLIVITDGYTSTIATISLGDTLNIIGDTGITSYVTDNNIHLDLDDTTVTPGSYGSSTQIPTFTVDQQGRITAASTQNISTTLTISDDSSTTANISLGNNTLKIAGGSGVDTSISGDTLTISLENTIVTETSSDTLTNKSISLTNNTITGTLSEFNTALSDANFASIDGVETLTNKSISGSSNTLTNIANSSLTNSSITIGSTSTALGATSTSLAGLTQLTVDNVDINGNTISSTDTNGNLSLSPNGQGVVKVPAGYTSRSNVDENTLITKGYADAIQQALNIHASVKAATTDTLANLTSGTVTYDNGTGGVTATLTLQNALTTLDDYTLLNGDRILVKNQANQAHNGIYTWATGGTVLTRATDFDTNTEIAPGDFIFVVNGTINGNNGFAQTSIITTVGSDNIIFTQFSGAGQIVAGDGLSKLNNTLNVTVDNSTIEIHTDSLRVKDSGITNDKLLYSGITIVDDTSSTTTISLGESLKLSGDTGITTTISGDTINIDLDDTAVTPSTYGSSTAIPVLTIDQQGRITSASTASISTTLNIVDDSSTLASIDLANDTLKIAGGTGLTSTISGDNITIDLDNTLVSAGSYGSSTEIPTFTVDAQGRLTAAGTANISTILTISDDSSSTASITLGSDTLKIAGGTGITSSISGDTITLDIDSDIVTETSSDTLTNKTISGSDNTITNISNSSLTNSIIKFADDTSTISSIPLGGTLKISGGTISGDTLTISGGGGISWQTTAQTSNFTALVNEAYFVNTTAGAITVTLPLSPNAGEQIRFLDLASTFDTNNLTIGRNGNKIMGLTENLIVSTEDASIGLIYTGSTFGWKLIENI
jgi:hypothetical protein